MTLSSSSRPSLVQHSVARIDQKITRDLTIKIPIKELRDVMDGKILKLNYELSSFVKLHFVVLLPTIGYENSPSLRIKIPKPEIDFLLKGKTISQSFPCNFKGSDEIINVLITKLEG